MASAGFTRRSVIGAAAVLAAPFVARAQQPTRFGVGTGPAGGVYRPLGEGIAKILADTLPALSAAAVPTTGTPGNVEGLSTEQLSLGMSQVDAAVAAFEGDGPYKGRPIALRALGVVYTNHMHLVSTAGSGIRSIADLRGKRVSTGAAGSATETIAFRLLVAASLDRNKDFAVREALSLVDGTEAIKAGKLDAYFYSSGLPTSSVTDLASSPGVQIALVDHADMAERIVARHGSVYFPDTIPAGTYPGQHADNQQVSVANILMVRAGMSDAQASMILGALWAARADMAQAHSEARNFTVEAQKTAAAGIPWHPAAEAFWLKQGANLA